jgi:hypothetical protein
MIGTSVFRQLTLFLLAVSSSLATDAMSQTVTNGCAGFSSASFAAPNQIAGVPAGQVYYASGPFAAGNTFTVTAGGVLPSHPSIPSPGDSFFLVDDIGSPVTSPVTAYGGTAIYTTPVEISRVGVVNNTAVDFVLIASAACAEAAVSGNAISPLPTIGRVASFVLLAMLGALGARKLTSS